MATMSTKDFLPLVCETQDSNAFDSPKSSASLRDTSCREKDSCDLLHPLVPRAFELFMKNGSSEQTDSLIHDIMSGTTSPVKEDHLLRIAERLPSSINPLVLERPKNRLEVAAGEDFSSFHLVQDNDLPNASLLMDMQQSTESSYCWILTGTTAAPLDHSPCSKNEETDRTSQCHCAMPNSVPQLALLDASEAFIQAAIHSSQSSSDNGEDVIPPTQLFPSLLKSKEESEASEEDDVIPSTQKKNSLSSDTNDDLVDSLERYSLRIPATQVDVNSDADECSDFLFSACTCVQETAGQKEITTQHQPMPSSRADPAFACTQELFSSASSQSISEQVVDAPGTSLQDQQAQFNEDAKAIRPKSCRISFAPELEIYSFTPEENQQILEWRNPSKITMFLPSEWQPSSIKNPFLIKAKANEGTFHQISSSSLSAPETLEKGTSSSKQNGVRMKMPAIAQDAEIPTEQYSDSDSHHGTDKDCPPPKQEGSPKKKYRENDKLLLPPSRQTKMKDHFMTTKPSAELAKKQSLKNATNTAAAFQVSTESSHSSPLSRLLPTALVKEKSVMRLLAGTKQEKGQKGILFRDVVWAISRTQPWMFIPTYFCRKSVKTTKRRQLFDVLSLRSRHRLRCSRLNPDEKKGYLITLVKEVQNGPKMPEDRRTRTCYEGQFGNIELYRGQEVMVQTASNKMLASTKQRMPSAEHALPSKESEEEFDDPVSDCPSKIDHFSGKTWHRADFLELLIISDRPFSQEEVDGTMEVKIDQIAVRVMLHDRSSSRKGIMRSALIPFRDIGLDRQMFLALTDTHV